MEIRLPASAAGSAWDTSGETAEVDDRLVAAAVGEPLDPSLGPSSAPPSALDLRTPESVGLSLDPAGTRNVTVLPLVENAGESVLLKPRSELRYQWVKALGKGAMGEVSLARDNDIGRTVAVKRLVRRVRNPEGIARFIEEIRTVGQLEHPNIVPIHDVGVDEQGQIFFVMKHIDGETLESVLAKLNAQDPEYLARYTIDYRLELVLGMLRALQFAHAQGIVHRDVKPANVMVGRYGEVVLMDWGLAKVSTQGPPAASSPFASQEGVVVGTVPDLVSSHRQSLK